MFENWLRLKVAYRLFFKDALLNIIHDPETGFPKDEKTVYEILLELRIREEPRLSHIITKSQWDTICHVCISEDESTETSCDDPCLKKGVSRIRTFDIPTMLAMIMGLSDLPPPKGAHGWRQELPRLGDGSRGAAVLLTKQFHGKMMKLSVRDVKDEDQANDLWDEMDIMLTGLNYKNISDFQKTRDAKLVKYYKVIFKVVIEYYEKIHKLLVEKQEQSATDRKRKPCQNNIMTRSEFETLKEGIEHYLENMDQSILGESAFEAISKISEYQGLVEQCITHDEELSQQNENTDENDENYDDGGSSEDNEQMLTCVVEGMKLHISGNIEDEDSKILTGYKRCDVTQLLLNNFRNIDFPKLAIWFP